MAYTDPVTLRGDLVTLTPLSPDDAEGLTAVVSDGELWRLQYTSVPTPEGVAAYVQDKLARQGRGEMLPFAVRLTGPDGPDGPGRADGAPGRIVGHTSLCYLDEPNRHLEIGFTWYAASVQRSGVNTEAKLLLLTHAFEELGCVRVEFRTHQLNRRSRAAIEGLGATLEGVLRQHQLMADGAWRNTCVYAMLSFEWPAAKAELRRRLAEGARR